MKLKVNLGMMIYFYFLLFCIGYMQTEDTSQHVAIGRALRTSHGLWEKNPHLGKSTGITEPNCCAFSVVQTVFDTPASQ